MYLKMRKKAKKILSLSLSLTLLEKAEETTLILHALKHKPSSLTLKTTCLLMPCYLAKAQVTQLHKNMMQHCTLVTFVVPKRYW